MGLHGSFLKRLRLLVKFKKCDLIICKLSGERGIFLGKTYQDLILVMNQNGTISYSNIRTWKVIK